MQQTPLAEMLRPTVSLPPAQLARAEAVSTQQGRRSTPSSSSNTSALRTSSGTSRRSSWAFPTGRNSRTVPLTSH